MLPLQAAATALQPRSRAGFMAQPALLSRASRIPVTQSPIRSGPGLWLSNTIEENASSNNIEARTCMKVEFERQSQGLLDLVQHEREDGLPAAAVLRAGKAVQHSRAVPSNPGWVQQYSRELLVVLYLAW